MESPEKARFDELIHLIYNEDDPAKLKALVRDLRKLMEEDSKLPSSESKPKS